MAALAAAIAVVLSGCARDTTVRSVLAQQCVRLGGPHQQIAIAVPVRAAGLLHLAIQELGISATAQLLGSGSAASSPIARLGTLTLTRTIDGPRVVRVRISSIDSRDIEGNVCISGELLNPPFGPRARAWRLIAAADQRITRQQWQPAFDDNLSAARLFDSLGMREHAADARNAMAELAYRHLQRTRDALALVATALTTRTKDRPAITGVRLELMGRALTEYSSQKELPRGAVIALLHAAAARFRSSAAARRELPRLAIHEGYVDYRSGIPAEAEREFNAAAENCKQLQDWECFAQAQMDVAAMAEDRQNYPTALADYEDALASLDISRMPKIGADIHYDLARLEGRVGLFRQSAADQDAAMRLYAQLGRCDLTRLSASSLGEMLVHVGSMSDAIDYLDRAATLDCGHLLEAAKSTGKPGVDFASDGSIAQHGISHIDGEQVAFAACVHPTSVVESTSDGNIAVFQALLTLGEIARSDDNLTITDACQTAARRYSVDARTQVRLLNARGELELQSRHVAAARETFAGALRLTQAANLQDASEFRGTAEQGLAEAALASGQITPARQHAAAALRLAIARGDITQLVASLRILASSEVATGNKGLASRTLRSAIALLEQVPTGELNPEQRATYLATQYAVFGELTDILTPQSGGNDGAQAWEAFEVVEEGHARSLRYAMELAVHERAVGAAQSGSQEYRALLRAITAMSPDRVANGDLPRKLDALARRSSSSEATVNRTELAGQLTKMNSVLVEYAAGHDEMYAFVTDGTIMHAVRLGPRAKIEHAATAFIEQLRTPEPDATLIRRAAKQLARLAWWPLRAYFDRPRILIVPDGALHTVPFAALPWSNESSSDLTVQHVELSSVPSTLLLTRDVSGDSDSSPGRARFVLLGDPVFRSNLWLRNCTGSAHAFDNSRRIGAPLAAAFQWARRLPSLPGTRAEIMSVARIARKWRRSAEVETLLGCAATHDALQDAAPPATVIHIATHGLVDARRPRLSALALTPGRDGDAAFRLFDILQLHLRARMVVLSACDTSQGRLLPGEGVLGLAQAFLQAGSQSVVATYWRVEDAKVEPFMERFYRHLLADRLPVGTALRRTQIELASQGDSYGWAAFSLYGRPDSML